jgi:hypothetical protein
MPARGFLKNKKSRIHIAGFFVVCISLKRLKIQSLSVSIFLMLTLYSERMSKQKQYPREEFDDDLLTVLAKMAVLKSRICENTREERLTSNTITHKIHALLLKLN